jgi:hypothetical protein
VPSEFTNEPVELTVGLVKTTNGVLKSSNGAAKTTNGGVKFTNKPPKISIFWQIDERREDFDELAGFWPVSTKSETFYPSIVTPTLGRSNLPASPTTRRTTPKRGQPRVAAPSVPLRGNG